MAVLDEFIELRILVAALGEKPNAGWWESSFLGEIGVRYLSYAFPRAPELAAIQGAVEAAHRVHDARIGTKGVTHLFRQSYEVELLILDHLKSNIDAIRNRMASVYSKPAACKSALEAIAGSPELGHEGPVLIGSLPGLPDTEGIRRMAAIYLGAINSGKVALPYFLSTP